METETYEVSHERAIAGIVRYPSSVKGEVVTHRSIIHPQQDPQVDTYIINYGDNPNIQIRSSSEKIIRTSPRENYDLSGVVLSGMDEETIRTVSLHEVSKKAVERAKNHIKQAIGVLNGDVEGSRIVPVHTGPKTIARDLAQAESYAIIVRQPPPFSPKEIDDLFLPVYEAIIGYLILKKESPIKKKRSRRMDSDEEDIFKEIQGITRDIKFHRIRCQRR